MKKKSNYKPMKNYILIKIPEIPIRSSDFYYLFIKGIVIGKNIY